MNIFICIQSIRFVNLVIDKSSSGCLARLWFKHGHRNRLYISHCFVSVDEIFQLRFTLIVFDFS